jgi:hypothetical protein
LGEWKGVGRVGGCWASGRGLPASKALRYVRSRKNHRSINSYKSCSNKVCNCRKNQDASPGYSEAADALVRKAREVPNIPETSKQISVLRIEAPLNFRRCFGFVFFKSWPTSRILDECLSWCTCTVVSFEKNCEELLNIFKCLLN